MLINKKSNEILLYICVIFLIVLTFTKIQNTNFNNDVNFKFETQDRCKHDVVSYKNLYPEEFIQIVNKPISVFPNVSNFFCLGTINNLVVEEKRIIVETSSSKRFEVLTNTLIFTLIYLNINNIKKSRLIFLISINSILLSLIYDYYFFTWNGLLWLLLKVIIIYYIFSALSEAKSLSIIFYLLVGGVLSDVLNQNITLNELTYFGHAIVDNSPYSAYIGDSHLYLFNIIVKYSNLLFGDSFKIILEIIICVWFAILVREFTYNFKINLGASIFLIILLIGQQSILSGEFYFGSVEGKVFAYLSLLTSFILGYKRNLLWSCFFYLLTLYFHASVAIVTFPVYIYIQLKKFELKNILTFNFVSFLFSLPLIINLMRQNLFSNMSIDSDIINSNLINMIKVRAPHHLYPFDKYSENLISINDQWIFGIAVMASILFFLFYLRLKLNTHNELLDISIFISIIFWIYLLIVFIFPFSQFTMLFPFRIGSIFLIFFYLFICSYISNVNIPILNFVSIVISLFVFLQGFTNVQNDYYFDELNTKIDSEILDFVSENEIDILLLPLYDSGSMKSTLNFIEYETQVPTYATWKFNAYNIRDISIWRERIDKLRNFYGGDCTEFANFSNIFFVEIDKDSDCGSLIFSKGNINIYKFHS